MLSSPGTSGGTHAIGRGVVQLPHGMWPLHIVQVNAWLAYADAEYASSCGGGQPSWKKCCSGMPNWMQRIRMAWNENIRNADEPRGILMPTLQNYGRLYHAVYQHIAVKPPCEPVNALRAP